MISQEHNLLSAGVHGNENRKTKQNVSKLMPGRESEKHVQSRWFWIELWTNQRSKHASLGAQTSQDYESTDFTWNEFPQVSVN